MGLFFLGFKQIAGKASTQEQYDNKLSHEPHFYWGNYDFLMNKKTKETLINIGSGFEMRIVDYANYLIKYLNTNLQIKFDLSKPDGTPRKIIDNNIAKKYGWRSRTSFEKGVKLTYQDFLKKNL